MSVGPRAAAPSAGRRIPSLDPLTMVSVAFGVTAIDVSWLEPEDAVILVHNDDLLPIGTVKDRSATDVLSGGNVGFGAGVNAALELVRTPRVVLCNPDTQLTPSIGVSWPAPTPTRWWRWASTTTAASRHGRSSPTRVPSPRWPWAIAWAGGWEDAAGCGTSVRGF